MKKLLVLLLAAVLLLTAGCGGTPVESTHGTTAAPAPESTAHLPETTSIPTDSPVTTEAATAEPSTAEAAATEAPEPVDPWSLLGELSFDQGTYTDDAGDSYTWSYGLPCVLADTEGANAINRAISDGFGNDVRESMNAMERGDSIGVLSVGYYGVVWEDVLSIVLLKHLYFDWTDYAVYNYEVSTGRQLTTPLLLEKMDISEDQFLERCRTSFRDHFLENYRNIPREYYESVNYYDMLAMQTTDEYINLDLMVYPENDDLVAVAPIISLAGPAFFYHPLHLGLGGPLALLGQASFEEGTYTDDSGNVTDYYFAVPCILADTEGARAINEAIDAFAGQIVRDGKETMEGKYSLIDYAVRYTGHVWKDILTVEIHVDNDWGCDYYGIYCYSADTGAWLKTPDVLQRMGISQEEFLNACRRTFRQTFIDMNNQMPEENREENGYSSFLEKTDSDSYVNMELQVFPNEDGELMVIAPIVSMAGADFYYHKLGLSLYGYE